MQNDKPYDAFVWLGKNFVELAVTNLEHSKVEAIKIYGKETGNITRNEALDVFALREIAKAQQVFVGLESDKFTLLPNELFDSAENRNYLSTLFQLTNNEICASQKVVPNNCHSIFSLKKGTDELIKKNLKTTTILHAPTSLLIAYQQMLPPVKKLVGFVRLNEKEIFITIYADKKLQLHQSYEIENIEDALYYYMNAHNVLGLDIKNSITSIHGSHHDIDTFKNILSQNILTAKYVARLPTLQYADETFNQPAHSFFNLFALILCAS